MKKILAIILAYVCVKLVLNMKTQEDADKEAQEKATAEKAAQKAEAAKQIQIKIIVDNFYNSQNGCLPVYASDWSPIAGISKDDWKYAKQEFEALGTTFKKMYDKIMNVSAKGLWIRTGFHKAEFDNIYWALRDRSKW